MQAERAGDASISHIQLGTGWVASNAVALALGHAIFIAAHYTDLVWPTRTLWPITGAAALQFGIFGLAQAVFLRRIGFRSMIWAVRTAMAGAWFMAAGLLSPSSSGYWRENPGMAGLHWPYVGSLKYLMIGTLAVVFLAGSLALAAVALQAAGTRGRLPDA